MPVLSSCLGVISLMILFMLVFLLGQKTVLNKFRQKIKWATGNKPWENEPTVIVKNVSHSGDVWESTCPGCKKSVFSNMFLAPRRCLSCKIKFNWV